MLRHIAVLTVAATCTNAAFAMSVEATDGGVRLAGDGVQCSLDARAQIHVTRAELSYVLGGLNARSDPDSFTQIAELLSTEVVLDEETRKAARAQYALADGARLVVELEVRAGIACLFVTSHLENLGDGALDRDRWPWYPLDLAAPGGRVRHPRRRGPRDPHDGRERADLVQ